MSKKLVVSDCCETGVQHFPANGLDPMNNVIFFCNKCGKACKTKVFEQDVKK